MVLLINGLSAPPVARMAHVRPRAVAVASTDRMPDELRQRLNTRLGTVVEEYYAQQARTRATLQRVMPVTALGAVGAIAAGRSRLEAQKAERELMQQQRQHEVDSNVRRKLIFGLGAASTVCLAPLAAQRISTEELDAMTRQVRLLLSRVSLMMPPMIRESADQIIKAFSTDPSRRQASTVDDRHGRVVDPLALGGLAAVGIGASAIALSRNATAKTIALVRETQTVTKAVDLGAEAQPAAAEVKAVAEASVVIEAKAAEELIDGLSVEAMPASGTVMESFGVMESEAADEVIDGLPVATVPASGTVMESVDVMEEDADGDSQAESTSLGKTYEEIVVWQARKAGGVVEALAAAEAWQRK